MKLVQMKIGPANQNLAGPAVILPAPSERCFVGLGASAAIPASASGGPRRRVWGKGTSGHLCGSIQGRSAGCTCDDSVAVSDEA
jgi:hypothetical protein